MANFSKGKNSLKKRDEILRAAKKLFAELGYEQTSVRKIVEEANTSMGNLYFHFPHKLSILKVISKEFITILRNQITHIHSLNFSPEVGFALDFRIGYITTLEDSKLSKLWLVVRNNPEIHQYSLENKRIRLRTFFGNQIPDGELDSLAIAIQAIADSFFEQKREGNLSDNSVALSNTIIDYSLRLLGYSPQRISEVIEEVEEYIVKHNITTADYFKNI
ncbi:TetR family transcriptional regulator [candidate division KSB1 bacterium]|nr:TetR family transcriptional regulator [candidate division KSB1 bacterium]